MRIIGLDVGEKRIGVAKVDSSTRIAIPVGFVLVDGSEWQEIAKIARINSTSLFVLGLPRSNEGNETKQTLYVRDFARKLAREVPGAKIRFQDESLTSIEAEKRLKSRKKPYEKGDIDAEAASIILQDFVEHFREQNFSNLSSSDTLKGARPSLRSSDDKLPRSIDKITLNAKKTSSKLKKWTIFGIPVVIILILLGITAGFKIRDYIRQQREEYYAKLEAEMQAVTFDFEIKPGETIFDIKSNLLHVDRSGGAEVEEPIPNYTAEEIDAAFSATYSYDFLNDRPEGASLEGYLYPEKYNFYADATIEDILNAFLTGMGNVISTNNLVENYAEHGLSLYEGIVLASVVQKEVPPVDMATAAQVFLTRIDYGMTLGSDASVTYALNVTDPEREIYQDNLAALDIDSCYNTRKYAGLPCGPVSNPGLSALTAVAHPTDTSYLFFLTGDDGVTYYSYTESEHNQNIYLHCKELCNMSL